MKIRRIHYKPSNLCIAASRSVGTGFGYTKTGEVGVGTPSPEPGSFGGVRKYGFHTQGEGLMVYWQGILCRADAILCIPGGGEDLLLLPHPSLRQACLLNPPPREGSRRLCVFA